MINHPISILYSKSTERKILPSLLFPDFYTNLSCLHTAKKRKYSRGFSRKKPLVLVTQSCLTFRNPMDCSLPGFSVYGIFQARILEWVAMPSSRGSSQPRMESVSLTSPALAGGFFTTSTTWEAHYVYRYVCVCVCVCVFILCNFLY